MGLHMRSWIVCVVLISIGASISQAASAAEKKAQSENSSAKTPTSATTPNPTWDKPGDGPCDRAQSKVSEVLNHGLGFMPNSEHEFNPGEAYNSAVDAAAAVPSCIKEVIKAAVNFNTLPPPTKKQWSTRRRSN